MFFGGNRDNNHGLGVIGAIAMMILAPIAAMLVQMAISRSREYEADGSAPKSSGNRVARLRAAKIAGAAHQRPQLEAERNPATAHMFIINPLSGAAAWTICSRPIPRPRTASPRCSSSPQSWVLAAERLPLSNTPRRGPWGRPSASRGPWG